MSDVFGKWQNQTNLKPKGLKITGWFLVWNEGINLYIGIFGMHSFIPY